MQDCEGIGVEVMAEKRMFSLSVVDTDWFLDLPLSTQALYFHLNMTAIVGFTDKKNNVTWIGSDSLGSNGFSKAVQANPKCFHNDTLKNVIMGSTSTFRHIDLLKYSETLFPEIDKYKIKDGEVNIDHRYMVIR